MYSLADNTVLEAHVKRMNDLVDMMCDAARLAGRPRPLHTGTIVLTTTCKELVGEYRWCGQRPVHSVDEDCAPWVARLKAEEVILKYALTGKKRISSPTDSKSTSGYQGAILREDSIGRVVVNTCSGWNQEGDKAVSSIKDFAWVQDVELHHYGVALRTEELLLEAVKQAEETLGVTAVELEAPDHRRFYLFVKDSRSPRGGYYIEYQWGEDLHAHDEHFDLWNPAGQSLLGYLAKDLEVEVERLEHVDSGSPIGFVSIQEGSRMLRFMVRTTWRNIQ